MLALDERGYRSRIFADSRRTHLAGLQVLVIAKSFKPEDYFLAKRAVKRGIPVVLDLCDNIFIDGYGSTFWRSSIADIFLEIVAFAAATVVTTAPLAEVVRSKTHNAVPIYVIADGIETPSKVMQAASWMEMVRLQLRPGSRLENHVRKMLQRLHGIRVRVDYLTHIAPRISSKALSKSAIKATWLYLVDAVRPQFATASPARAKTTQI